MNLLKNFHAEAIIFDKDGTLIDFDAMWGGWTLQLAERVETSAKINMREALCECYGYDRARRKGARWKTHLHAHVATARTAGRNRALAGMFER